MTETTGRTPPGAPGDQPPEYAVGVVTSLAERRTRTLKHDDTFGVFDHHGDILYAEGRPDGLFYQDTRHLSHLELRINGRCPLMLNSGVKDEGNVLTADMANPDLHDGGRLMLASELIHIARAKFLYGGACYERIAVRNYDTARHRVTLDIAFQADFIDLFEARGQQRKARGTVLPSRRRDGAAIVLRYQGLDGVERLTELHFDPQPTVLESNRAGFDLDLGPGERAAIFLTVSFVQTGAPMPVNGSRRHSFFVALYNKVRSHRAAARRQPRIATSNNLFNEVVRRSASDLDMLMTLTGDGRYPYAGVPWFSTAFGRDGIITALELLWLDPGVALGVLRYLARNQAREEDPENDAEPGKILHETRAGEMAYLKEVPFGRYYGSVDATPLFVMLAGAYLRRTGDVRTIQGLWPNIRAALDWIDQYGDRDGDGFVEYDRKTPEGLANQGWKDSHDSVFHEDGTMARGPIALVEVQGYAYAARVAGAAMARRLGRYAEAALLEQQADRLRIRFEQAFWCEDLGTYALALDGDKRPCRVRSSNAGHALFAGIADPERAVRVAGMLLSGESFSGWGVRTVPTNAVRYNPMSYHNGSIWPHDNALVALGLARYGHKEAVRRIFRGLFDAASHSELRRLPELFCGFTRRQGRGPVSYPVACSPQAWASAAPLALLQAALGISFDADRREIRLDRPLLPRFLDEVRLTGLRLGDAEIDVLLHRHELDVAVTITRRQGDLHVVTVN